MDKTKKIIIACSVALAVAAAVLIATVVRSNISEKAAQTTDPVYVLQKTTSSQTDYNTESWVDINQIAGNLTTTLEESSTDLSTTGVVVPSGDVTKIVYVDANGNIIDPNQLTNPSFNTTTTKIDSQDALDTPVTEAPNEMGVFKINDKGIITDYYGDSDAVIIPVKEQGKKVVGIGKECFKDSKIKSIYIPDTVTSIGDSAFENCASLSNISFASNITKVTIGQAAFKNCIALREITLPAAISVGMLAFDNCTALKKVIFSKGTESVGAYCFSNCRSLESVYMPSSITKFGTKVFDNCDQGKLKVFTPLGSDAESYAQNAGYKTAEY